MEQKQLTPRKKCIEMENKNELCQLFTLTLKRSISTASNLLCPSSRPGGRSGRWGLDLHSGTHTAGVQHQTSGRSSSCGQRVLTSPSFPRKADYI